MEENKWMKVLLIVLGVVALAAIVYYVLPLVGIEIPYIHS
jgi:uncharacterized membrane protein